MVLALTAHKTGNLINPPVTCICLSTGKNTVIPSAIWNSCHWSMSMIHQGQTRLDKPDHPLWQSNVLSSCRVSGGHCLPGFLQSFRYGFPQPPPGETGMLWSRQVVCAVFGEAADQLIQSTWHAGKLLHSKPVTSGDPQGSLLGSTLLPAFINDMGGRIKCTLMTFACETKLSGKMKTLKWRAILQENLDGLKERDKNLIKFNKILHLGKCSPGV